MRIVLAPAGLAFRLTIVLGAVLLLGLPDPAREASRRVEAASSAAVGGTFEVRGISYPSFRDGSYDRPESRAVLAELAKMGANFVAIIPTQFSKSAGASTFRPTAATETDGHIVAAIVAAHALGLKVMLKPHVDPMDGKPRAAYAPADVGDWFHSYRALLVHYATLAAAQHVELFSIGCELDSLVGAPHRADWLEIVRAVRAIYPGPIIYAADWLVERDVSFWDAVDYIGVDAYDPLSRSAHPSVAELAGGWVEVSADSWVAARSGHRSPLQRYRYLWETYHKPVIFTEIGYKSIAGAAARPGDWRYRAPVDLTLQANAFEAFFEVWSRQSAWMKGAFLWNWDPVLHPERSAAGLADYSPQNKPAGAVIARWYGAMAAAATGRRPAADGRVPE